MRCPIPVVVCHQKAEFVGESQSAAHIVTSCFMLLCDMLGTSIGHAPLFGNGASCSSVVQAFAHGAMGRRIDPLWWSYYLYKPVLHDWCKKGCGMC